MASSGSSAARASSASIKKNDDESKYKLDKRNANSSPKRRNAADEGNQNIKDKKRSESEDSKKMSNDSRASPKKSRGKSSSPNKGRATAESFASDDEDAKRWWNDESGNVVANGEANVGNSKVDGLSADNKPVQQDEAKQQDGVTSDSGNSNDEDEKHEDYSRNFHRKEKRRILHLYREAVLRRKTDIESKWQEQLDEEISRLHAEETETIKEKTLKALQGKKSTDTKNNSTGIYASAAAPANPRSKGRPKKIPGVQEMVDQAEGQVKVNFNKDLIPREFSYNLPPSNATNIQQGSISDIETTDAEGDENTNDPPGFRAPLKKRQAAIISEFRGHHDVSSFCPSFVSEPKQIEIPPLSELVEMPNCLQIMDPLFGLKYLFTTRKAIDFYHSAVVEGESTVNDVASRQKKGASSSVKKAANSDKEDFDKKNEIPSKESSDSEFDNVDQCIKKTEHSVEHLLNPEDRISAKRRRQVEDEIIIPDAGQELECGTKRAGGKVVSLGSKITKGDFITSITMDEKNGEREDDDSDTLDVGQVVKIFQHIEKGHKYYCVRWLVSGLYEIHIQSSIVSMLNVIDSTGREVEEFSDARKEGNRTWDVDGEEDSDESVLISDDDDDFDITQLEAILDEDRVRPKMQTLETNPVVGELSSLRMENIDRRNNLQQRYVRHFEKKNQKWIEEMEAGLA